MSAEPMPVVSPSSRQLKPGDLVAHIAATKRPWQTRPHKHPVYEFLYVIKGCKKFLLNGQTYFARSGDLIIFRPGDVHQEWSVSKDLLRMVIRCHPKSMAAAEAAMPPGVTLGPVVRLPWKARFQELFARMSEENARPRTCGEMLMGAYLVEFAVLLARAAEELSDQKPRKDADVQRSRVLTAIEMIQSNISASLTLKELARSSFMSVSHFSHVFTEEVGKAPKEYLIEERIKRAKQLLSTTTLTVQQVAKKLGYANPYYFYRLFKKKTGMTAGQYVRTARKCI
jgi:AraC-like DNA-binding protein